MAINIQIEVIRKIIPAIPGMTANTLINPGELANPMVRNSSPGWALVCGSGRILAPTKYVIYAQAYQAISAMIAPIMIPFTPIVPIVPMPAAILERTTTPMAWPIAPLSASTSSYRLTSSLAARTMRFI